MSQDIEAFANKKIMKIMNRLCKAVKFGSDLPKMEVKSFPNFQSKEIYKSFRNKITIKLDIRKETNSLIELESFDWKQVKIENPTGNEMLRQLIAIWHMEDLYAAGNCIVFTANENPVFAIFQIFSGAWECTAPSIDKHPANRKYYDKTFDEKKCKWESREDGEFKQYYTSKRLEKIRGKVAQKFDDFLQKPIMKCDVKFRNPFMGVLTEIANHETRVDPVHEVPVAGCVYLSVHDGFTPELQAVFGEHYRPVDDWIEEYRTKGLQHLHGEHGYVVERKFELRYKAAKEIVKKSFDVNEDGSYAKEKLKDARKELKNYFKASN